MSAPDDGGFDPGRTFTVEGQVLSPGRVGTGGLFVEIIDRNVGRDVRLGEAVTDATGRYRATLTAPAKSRPDLQARLWSRDDPAATFLGECEVRYDASDHEVLDIELRPDAAGLASEYEVLREALNAIHAGPLAGLEESDERQDVTYLANKAGWDARAVAMAALADKHARDEIPAPLYYALFRAGLPADPATLYRARPAIVEGVWRGALGQVVPAALEADLPRARRAFEELSVDHVLDAQAVAGTSTLKEMLDLTFTDDEDGQRTFAGLYQSLRHDPPAFWENVEATFDRATAEKLRLDGQLGALTLNNAPLIGALRTAEEDDPAGDGPLTGPVDLARRGYFRADRWSDLIGDVVPERVPGATRDEKAATYAELLAAQVRLSFPTAVLAEQVRSGDVLASADQSTRDDVHAFLADNLGKFEIGLEPVEGYLARNPDVEGPAGPRALEQIERIQRVYQLTPTDEAMKVLLDNDLDSAATILRHDEEQFVAARRDDLGEDDAKAIYARSKQINNAVLNIVSSFLTARVAPPLGRSIDEPILDPGSLIADSASGVIAYPTLEGLFGSMDYCACEHCRSVLSPAAYLVDLLRFLDDPDGDPNPLDVLLARRPDVQHLPLTCDNTNVPVPQIDLVNETLEYFIGHAQSLAGYRGHDTDASVDAQELLASPQHIDDAVYETLAVERYPAPLPFALSLETLRRLYAHCGVPLHRAMALLRKNDDIERSAAVPYGWRDILMEQLGVSRAEHRLLTDGALTLNELFGYETTTPPADVLRQLMGVKELATRLAVSYEELVALLKTRFINPNGAVVARLKQLSVALSEVKRLKDGVISAAQFAALIPSGVDPADFGGDIPAWLTRDENYRRIMALVILAKPAGAPATWSFEDLELRYSDPDANRNALRSIDLVRLLRFVRLWRKLGWSIEQTDTAIGALYPPAQRPSGPEDPAALQKLDAGCRELLIGLGIAVAAMQRMGLSADEDLSGLLACWAPIDTQGRGSLYRTLFGRASPLFRDNGFGDLAPAAAPGLLAHAEALRAALGLTAEDFDQIVARQQFVAGTPLTLDNVSAIYRRAWLARALGLGVRELLALVRRSGVDPFATPAAPEPGLWRFLDLLDGLRAANLAPAAVLELLWNEDVGGQARSEDPAELDVVRQLRESFTTIDSELPVDSVDEDRARDLLALAFGADAAAFFFGLLSGALSVEVDHAHPQAVLSPQIVDAAGARIAYDPGRKRLSYAGVVTTTVRDAVKAAAPGDAAFTDAVDRLFAASEAQAISDATFAVSDATIEQFFSAHPALRPLISAYVLSAEPPERKRQQLLASFVPELREQRRRREALAIVSAAATTAPAFAEAVLGDAEVLHAATDPARPALDDLIALRTGGLGPRDPDGIVDGYLQVPAGGSYRLAFEIGLAAIALELDGEPVDLVADDGAVRTAAPRLLAAGVLHPIRLKVATGTGAPAMSWQLDAQAWEPVADRYLYGAPLVLNARAAHTRFGKAAELAGALGLSGNEMAHLAGDRNLHIANEGWLNAVTVSGSDPPPGSLIEILEALLDFARLKAALAPGDERLLAVLRDLAGSGRDDAAPLLTSLTRWDPGSLDALLTRFGTTRQDLARVTEFARVYDAYAVLSTLGTSATSLLGATTNEPDAAAVRAMESALQARSGLDAWLRVLRSVNDPLRGLRRDALVARILRELARSPTTSHVDTPDKLFEFFLMDVQMQPCMQTSRIRHALSAVQLFVERVLMNLDPEVPATSVNRSRWEWIKRYRLWEANRQVFLWPENWLEPELRKDQSAFFRQTMSELLQSDITDDTAATALLGYLSSLEEVAKLEPCSIHYFEGAPMEGDEVAHVVARTAGAQRKYYYRQRKPGSWTAWEPIPLDIEDNPITPVFWKGRLLLFWLKILQSPVDQPPVSTDPTPLAQLAYSTIRADGARTLKLTPQAVLCWSEFYNGKWQPPKTSSINNPTGFGGPFAVSGPGAFNRARLVLGETTDGDGLRVRIWGQGGPEGTSFILYNTHSLPLRREDEKDPPDFDTGASRRRELSTSAGGSTFEITYTNIDSEAAVTRQVIKTDGGPYETVAPFPWAYGRDAIQQSLVQDVWTSPFFFQDSRHAFYVTTDGTDGSVSDTQLFGVAPTEPQLLDIPPLRSRVTDGSPEPTLEVPRTLIDSTGGVSFGIAEIIPRGRAGAAAKRVPSALTDGGSDDG